MAYQSPGAMQPHLSLGRTVAGIAVVSVRRGGVVSIAQSVADFLSGTLVVKLPPPQAHRAPAVPMFSAHDAEFGVPPRRCG